MDANETEWQFEADDLDRVARWLREQSPSAALKFTSTKDVIQRDVYLDTEDWDIHRAKFSLRLRRREGKSEATLKALGSAAVGPQVRREISQALADGEDVATASGPVSERLRLLCGERHLRPLFDIETHRLSFQAEDNGAPVAELALDDARIEVQGLPLAFLKRVEVECIGDSAHSLLLQSFVAALAEAMELRPAGASKFESGLVAAGLQPELPLSFEVSDLAGEISATEFALSVLRRFFAELVAHEPGTRLGEDPEELHDMRVALRRLRAALTMFKDALPAEFVEVLDDLRWLGRALGEVRDLDVQIMAFVEKRAAASWDEGNSLGELMAVLEHSRIQARKRLIETLESDRYRALLLVMDALLSPSAEAIALDEPARDYVTPVLKERYRRFRDRAQDLNSESDPAQFHAVRILGKRLRYAVEFSRLLYGKPAERLAGAVTKVQDLLGEYHDASVAIDWLRSLARDRDAVLERETLLFMGDLIAHDRARMQELRNDYPSAFDNVKRRWRGLRKELDRESPEEPIETASDVMVPAISARVSPRRFAVGPLSLLRRRRRPLP